MGVQHTDDGGRHPQLEGEIYQSWAEVALVSTLRLVSPDHNYEIRTIELGPYNDLSKLVSDLANHASTAATLAWQSEGQVVVSVSHAITSIDGRLFGTVLLTTDEQT